MKSIIEPTMPSVLSFVHIQQLRNFNIHVCLYMMFSPVNSNKSKERKPKSRSRSSYARGVYIRILYVSTL